MGINTKKMYELFETKWLMQSQNPGGKSPYLQGCLLGFAGTVDLGPAVNAQKKGELKIKIGNGEVQTKLVDFSGAADAAALTAAEAVAALNDAEFDDCEFSVDGETGRLKLEAAESGVKFLQIYGDLAAALNFGNCRLNEGKGCFIFASFDGDLKQAEETEEFTENQEIINESPRGTPVKHVIPGRRTGAKIVLTDRVSSRIARQMINGGRLISATAGTPEIYEPPAGNNTGTRRVDVFTFSEIFDTSSSTTGGECLIRERLYIGCVGKAARTGGSGSWNDSEYTLAADSYTEDGVEKASPIESDYTQAQWAARRMDGVIVYDWENA